MFWVKKALRKSHRRRRRKINGSPIQNNYVLKGSSLICFLFLLLGCQSDITIAEQRQTHVVIDSFVQAASIEKLDVLVTLDTSGSMSDNYDEVADGMDILRRDIESITSDYQFGYITMDPTNLSYTGPYDSSSSAIDMLMAPSLLPMTSLEEGFGATYSFLNSEEGYGFRRTDADFLLFLISDEDEQSAITATLFYDWMEEEFEDVQHDVVCVVNPDDGSEQFDWQNEIGYKYIELSDLYGKEPVDLQVEDWSVWLSESSYLVVERDSIQLSDASPIVESIVVYINNDITENWVYKADSNTVYLGFVPDSGDLVEVGYDVYEN
jgi:hypothetical protein|tara:strand:+ start:5473 stop:6441 length:969 start_codon:yes stop_codon:yes gene_type:complete